MKTPRTESIRRGIDSSRNRFKEHPSEDPSIEQMFDDKMDDKASFDPGFLPVDEDPIEATARFDAPSRMPSSSYLYYIW